MLSNTLDLLAYNLRKAVKNHEELRTREDLAKASGVSVRTIGRIYTASMEDIPRRATLHKLEEALGLELDSLLREEKEPASTPESPQEKLDQALELVEGMTEKELIKLMAVVDYIQRHK